MSNPPQAPIVPSPVQPGPPKKGGARGCLYLFLAGLGVVVLLTIAGVVAAISGQGKTSNNSGKAAASAPSPTAAATASATSTPHAPGVGTKVRDGKFQFTITKVTHAKTIGGSFGTTAQGEYTILHITITNIGNQAQTVDDSSQYVFDAKGRKFSADSQADIYANGNTNSVFLNDINPGNTIRCRIVFDMPAGDRAVKAELHDSAFSDGVTVRLTR